MPDLHKANRTRTLAVGHYRQYWKRSGAVGFTLRGFPQVSKITTLYSRYLYFWIRAIGIYPCPSPTPRKIKIYTFSLKDEALPGENSFQYHAAWPSVCVCVGGGGYRTLLALIERCFSWFRFVLFFFLSLLATFVLEHPWVTGVVAFLRRAVEWKVRLRWRGRLTLISNLFRMRY